MKKNYKSILLLVSLLLLFITYLIHSNMILKEIESYTLLFFKNVFPSCFIFLLLSYLLIENNLFNYINKIIKNKGLYFLLVSLISGYPTGSIYIKEALLKKEITIKEANKYIMFSHFPNPLFVMYHCNKLFPNSHIPMVFYSLIIISNILIFLKVSKSKSTNQTIIISNCSFTKSFTMALSKTFSTMKMIYGTSIFFYLLSTIITHLFPLPSILYVWICGTFDMTNGIIASNIIPNTTIKGLFLYYFIVFGSIPIHLQIKNILSDTSISYKNFFKGRALSFLLCIWIWIIYLRS